MRLGSKINFGRINKRIGAKLNQTLAIGSKLSRPIATLASHHPDLARYAPLILDAGKGADRVRNELEKHKNNPSRYGQSLLEGHINSRLKNYEA